MTANTSISICKFTGSEAFTPKGWSAVGTIIDPVVGSCVMAKGDIHIRLADPVAAGTLINGAVSWCAEVPVKYSDCMKNYDQI